MRHLLLGFLIEGTVFKRYPSDHKKCVHVKEMGDLDGCIGKSPNYKLCYNRGVCFFTVVERAVSYWFREQAEFSSHLTTVTVTKNRS